LYYSPDGPQELNGKMAPKLISCHVAVVEVSFYPSDSRVEGRGKNDTKN
jgi:hypothetical protein